MNKHFAIVSLLAIVSLGGASCSNQEEVFDRELAEAELNLPTDPRAEKPPGCITLAALGYFDDQLRVNANYTGSVDQEIDKVTESMIGASQAQITHAKRNLNECEIHVVHIKDIAPNDAAPASNKKQVIINILADIKNDQVQVYDVGVKFTCWTDETEQWRHEGACPKSES